MAVLPAGTDHGHVRIVVGRFSAARFQQIEEDVAGRFAVVIDIGLVGEANDRPLLFDVEGT